MYETENETAQSKIKDPLVAARETAAEIAEPLKEKALEVANDQKDMGADQLKVLARAMEGASQAVSNDVPQFAKYIKKLGGQIEKTSDTIRESDLEDLGEALSGFARRNPALVFGGAMLAGLALSRFIKSSTPSVPPNA